MAIYLFNSVRRCDVGNLCNSQRLTVFEVYFDR